MDGNQAGSRATRVLAIPSKAQGPGDGQGWCSAQATAAAASSSPLGRGRDRPRAYASSPAARDCSYPSSEASRDGHPLAFGTARCGRGSSVC